LAIFHSHTETPSFGVITRDLSDDLGPTHAPWPLQTLPSTPPAQGGVAQSAPLQPPSHAQPLSVHEPWPEQLALHESSATLLGARAKVRIREKVARGRV